jgi:phage shock protein E
MERLTVDTQTPFKHMLLILLAAIIAIFSINALASKRSDIAWQALEQGAVLIDVRTASEYRADHIEGAVNMPLSSIQRKCLKTCTWLKWQPLTLSLSSDVRH